jgi:hypothetical protein
MVLPDFTSEGDLPVGVHRCVWPEFRLRFGTSTPRRIWLVGRLKALVSLAGSTGKLQFIFVWGSFVTAKPSPKDLDILFIMDEHFELDRQPPQSKPYSTQFGRDYYSNPMCFGRELPSARTSSRCGWKHTRFPEPFENAVSWNWCCRD